MTIDACTKLSVIQPAPTIDCGAGAVGSGTDPMLFNANLSDFIIQPEHRLDGFDLLLGDSDGVDLFTKFLTCKYSSGHFLDFWFACKGFRSNVDPSDPDKLFQVAKVIYRTYIKTGAVYSVPLPQQIKQEIVDRMSFYHKGYKTTALDPSSPGGIDRGLFDDAQEHVKTVLEHRFYPEFIRFVSGKQPPSASFTRPNCSSAAHPEIPSVDHSRTDSIAQTAESPRTRVKLKRKDYRHNSRHSADGKLDERGQQSLTTYQVKSVHNFECPSNPDASFTTRMIQYVPDRTCYQENSTSETPVVERHFAPVHSSSAPRSHSLVETRPTNLQSANNNENRIRKLNDNWAATKERQNLAETDPTSFVLLLTSKLEKIKESRGKMEKLLSWVSQVDEKNATEADASQFDDQLDFAETHRFEPGTTELKSESQMIMPKTLSPPGASEPSYLRSASPSHAYHQVSCKPGTKSKFFDPTLANDLKDDAQGILDDHFSRIWADDRDLSEHGNKWQGTADFMVNSYCAPSSLPLDPTLRRSRLGLKCLSSHHRPPTPVNMFYSYTSDGSHDYPTQRRRTFARSNSGVKTTKRSDARSTASWDSGVVANVPISDIVLENSAVQGDIETRSIIAAASLQALSSSTTELAMVNSEVTAKLVEHMTRQYCQRPKQKDYSVDHALKSNGNFTANAKNASPYQNYDLLCPLSYQHNSQQDSSYGLHANRLATDAKLPHIHSSVSYNEAFPSCASYVQNWPHPHGRECSHGASANCQKGVGYLAQRPNANKSMHVKHPSGVTSARGQQSLLTASDTSSTFDSGISSTYDQLPLVSNGDRENRSQSVLSWQANRNTNPLPQNRHVRAPSAPRPLYNEGSMRQSAQHGGAGTFVYDNKVMLNVVPGNGHQLRCDNPPGEDLDLVVLNGPDAQNHVASPNSAGACNCKQCLTRTIATLNSDFPAQSSVLLEKRLPPSGGDHLLQHWLQLQASATTHPIWSRDPPTADNTILSKASKQTPTNGRKQHVHRRSGTTHKHGSKQAANAFQSHSLVPSSGGDSEANTKYLSTDHDTDEQKIHCSSDSAECASSAHQNMGLIVGYYLCDDPVPYRTVWTGPLNTVHPTADPAANSVGMVCAATNTQCTLTLGQFKQLIAKKGVYRYFFKKPSDEFGTGAVHEELTQDDAVLPLWDGKVVARIERAE
ncbi:unnamed protein product [Calicophoron daubneyi]|uniref:Axin-1 n=1 Tax=Calicophoron daubneyi TaxID=300641 RepID=A0AAV2TFN0_CALDB